MSVSTDMAIPLCPIKPIHIIAYVFGGDTIFSLHPQLQLAVECIDMINTVLVLFSHFAKLDNMLFTTMRTDQTISKSLFSTPIQEVG